MDISLQWLEERADCQTARELLELFRQNFESAGRVPSKILLNYLRKEGGISKETMEAWLLGQEEGMTRQLIKDGANPNAAKGYALRWAVLKGRKRVFKILAEKGSDIHVLGELALQLAVEKGSIAFVNLIIEKSEKGFYKDSSYLSEYIRIAKKRGFQDIVSVLEAAFAGRQKGAGKENKTKNLI